jgi:hypothetical protein
MITLVLGHTDEFGHTDLIVFAEGDEIAVLLQTGRLPG